MHNTANVYLWGTRVGTVLLQDESPIAKFQYSDEFLDMGVEVSPLMMPLSSSVFEFPELPIKSFHGLPPLLRALREHARAQGARGAGRSQERGALLAALRRRGGGPR